VWNLDYRRVGDEGGGYPGTFEDVLTALEFLYENADDWGVDRERTAAVGHSAGGHLALWLAGQDAVSAVVSQAGVADLVEASRDRLGLGSEKEGLGVLDTPATDELLGGTWQEQPDRYAHASPAELIGVFEGPMLVIHGDKDNRVPVEHGRAYRQALRAADADVEYVEFAGMGHFEVLDPEHESWTSTVAFLDRVLKAG
jgi:acetyl esterase/lipase